MRLLRLTIDNFRSLDGFVFDFEGESRFLIGENAIGKSTLLTAIVRALGRERAFARTDFLDLSRPVDIRATFSGLDAHQLGVFADAADFGATTTVTFGAMAVWDSDNEEVEVTLGYPTKAWQPSKRAERDAVELYLIPETRDAARALQFGSRRGLLADTIAGLDIEKPIATAVDEIRKACGQVASVAELEAAIQEAGVQLRRLTTAGPKPYEIGSAASTELEILRQLQLMLNHAGTILPIANQSGGMMQLTLFAFSMIAIRQRPGSLLLIDEPEVSLHPHAQRALLHLLQGLPNQYIVATHSATLLDRADARQLVRLHRDSKKIVAARATSLTAPEAARLGRFTTPENAEAFFARSVILVEGRSDKYALEAVAAKKGRNLDADGVTIVSMQGAGGINAFLKLLGPNGLKLKLAGLCDASDESRWAQSLESQGFGKKLTRKTMEPLGFAVCDKDLEEVLIKAVGEKEVLGVIDAQGETSAFKVFSQQPHQSSKALGEQLREFIHSRNITYAPLLVDCLDVKSIPPMLELVINAV